MDGRRGGAHPGAASNLPRATGPSPRPSSSSAAPRRSARRWRSIAACRSIRSPKQLEWQVGEGLRTSMRAVFEAIAHRSPFPKENFSEDRWNHMVLKALFIGSTLAPIQGLDERANPTLAEISADYAHERWAAGRPVTPELWRCIGPLPKAA